MVFPVIRTEKEPGIPRTLVVGGCQIIWLCIGVKKDSGFYVHKINFSCKLNFFIHSYILLIKNIPKVFMPSSRSSFKLENIISFSRLPSILCLAYNLLINLQ